MNSSKEIEEACIYTYDCSEQYLLAVLLRRQNSQNAEFIRKLRPLLMVNN
jgi:hypothetical protein